MDDNFQVERVRAVLGRLRDQLVDHQQRQPNPCFVPAELAELFNDTLADVEHIYGPAWVASVSISRWSTVPASTRLGGYPVVASVSRETLLSHLRTALRRLNTETRVRQDAAVAVPAHSHVAATSVDRSLPKSSA